MSPMSLYPHMSPSDAVAALRSFPRRYRAVLGRGEEEDQERMANRRPGPDQWSALEHVAHVTAVLDATAPALQRILVSDRPEVDVTPAAPAPSDLDGTLAGLEAAATRLAAVADEGKGEAWSRAGRIDGDERSALDLLRQAVEAAATRLRQVEEVLAQVRGRPEQVPDDAED